MFCFREDSRNSKWATNISENDSLLEFQQVEVLLNEEIGDLKQQVIRVTFLTLLCIS